MSTYAKIRLCRNSHLEKTRTALKRIHDRVSEKFTLGALPSFNELFRDLENKSSVAIGNRPQKGKAIYVFWSTSFEVEPRLRIRSTPTGGTKALENAYWLIPCDEYIPRLSERIVEHVSRNRPDGRINWGTLAERLTRAVLNSEIELEKNLADDFKTCELELVEGSIRMLRCIRKNIKNDTRKLLFAYGVRDRAAHVALLAEASQQYLETLVSCPALALFEAYQRNTGTLDASFKAYIDNRLGGGMRRHAHLLDLGVACKRNLKTLRRLKLDQIDGKACYENVSDVLPNEWFSKALSNIGGAISPYVFALFNKSECLIRNCQFLRELNRICLNGETEIVGYRAIESYIVDTIELSRWESLPQSFSPLPNNPFQGVTTLSGLRRRHDRLLAERREERMRLAELGVADVGIPDFQLDCPFRDTYGFEFVSNKDSLKHWSEEVFDNCAYQVYGKAAASGDCYFLVFDSGDLSIMAAIRENPPPSKGWSLLEASGIKNRPLVLDEKRRVSQWFQKLATESNAQSGLNGLESKTATSLSPSP